MCPENMSSIQLVNGQGLNGVPWVPVRGQAGDRHAHAQRLRSGSLASLRSPTTRVARRKRDRFRAVPEASPRASMRIPAMSVLTSSFTRNSLPGACRCSTACRISNQDHADPRVGNTVKGTNVVSLWFTQNVERTFSTIEVLDSNGAQMNAGNAVVDKSDRRLFRVPMKILPAGIR
jgi:hypothetical protein